MPDRPEENSTVRRCRELWERLYPDVKKPETYFRGWFEEAAVGGGWTLDVGAGAGGVINFKSDHPDLRSVALDTDFEAVKKNSSVRFRVVGSAGALPFRDSVFGAATAQYSLEHLEQPERFFSELSRVSLPGARFTFMTTNSTSLLGLGFRLMPQSIQSWIKKKFLKMEEKEIYPLRLRCNSRRRLIALLNKHGFNKPELIYVGGPFYFQFSYMLFRLAVLLEKLTDGRLKHLKFYIIGRT